ncbi:helix-turn-helix transcriptional regulator [Enterococcus crotali]|uniref:helix-turn-helix transcriptional regulator n=1 Tax=Enterococcus crotali TaxID=1453587 RepID=UPI000471980F|nr:helix-turn-helix transcriptional regulator [Enterococcus crotali]
MNKNILKKFRESLHLTSKDVYSDICDRRTYIKIENDIASGKLEVLLAICHRIGISLQELLHYYNLEENSESIEDLTISNIHSENIRNLAYSIKSISNKKFYNPKILSRFIGLKTITHRHSEQPNSLTISPKDINNIIDYYTEKRGRWLYSSDYEAFGNLIPAVTIQTTEKLEHLFIPYKSNEMPSSEVYTALLVIYGNYIDKCLEENNLRKALQLVKQFNTLPQFYNNFEYSFWIKILENLVLYSVNGNFEFYITAVDYFKAIKLTKNETLIKAIGKQIKRIHGDEANEKQLLILHNNDYKSLD